jgi:PIN domain nuclease of toxin-antitoxin system
MATKHVVDAHALVWYLEGNPRLGTNAKVILDDPKSELVLPIIALAEACCVVEYRKSSIPTMNGLLARVDAGSRIVVSLLDRTVPDKSLTLSVIPEMHDRQITARALCLAEQGESIAVLTKDPAIRSSGLVPIIW